jgi:hypothetical protein
MAGEGTKDRFFKFMPCRRSRFDAAADERAPEVDATVLRASGDDAIL